MIVKFDDRPLTLQCDDLLVLPTLNSPDETSFHLFNYVPTSHERIVLNGSKFSLEIMPSDLDNVKVGV